MNWGWGEQVKHNADGHEQEHEHGVACGHLSIPHRDHTDYVVEGHLHHPHEGHCDDRGELK
jgi:hypothetical protein